MRNLLIIVILVLSLGVVAAHDTEYKERFDKNYFFDNDVKVVSKTIWTYYENDKRLSTKNYRHGYSYRVTEDYFEDKYFRDDNSFYKKKSYGVVLSGKKKWKGYHWEDYSDYGKKRYSYEYVPHSRGYEKRECYVSPPANKLFYVKC